MTCDLAETYRIYDYKSLPVGYVAVLACGLRNDSRVMKKLSDGRDFDRELLVSIYDSVRMLVWLNSSDGQEGTNRPKSLYNILFNKNENPTDAKQFESAEDFHAEWERIINGNNS